MTDILIYIADRLKGKSLYPLFRWILNIIFCISISDAIFSKTHPDINLPDTPDLQKRWTFFVAGHFAIPLIILLLVYFVTQGLTILFFFYYGDYKNFKLTKKILAYNMEKIEVHESIDSIAEICNQYPIVDLTKEKLLEMYSKFKTIFDKKKLAKLQSVLEESKITVSDNFATILRGFESSPKY